MIHLEADNGFDAYVQLLGLLLENGSREDVAVTIKDAHQNYVVPLPHLSDDLAWILRETSDLVEGSLAPGGLHLRYDSRRARYFKASGVIDWAFKDCTGKPHPMEVFDSGIVEPQITGAVDAEGQLHHVLNLLQHDPGSDKASIMLFRWKKDLVEYTKRRWHMGTYSDREHQRVTCGLVWNYNFGSRLGKVRTFWRHNVFYQHWITDMFRPCELGSWLGGHLKKQVGKAEYYFIILRQIFYRHDRAQWEARYKFWKEHSPITDLYPSVKPDTKTLKLFDFREEWDLKERIEQDLRLAAFEEADEKIGQLQTQYFADWVNVMKIAELCYAEKILESEKEYSNPNLKTSRAYLGKKSEPHLKALRDIVGYFQPQAAGFLLNWFLRTNRPKEAAEVLEVLPQEVRDLVLVAYLKRVKDKPGALKLIPIRPEVLTMSEFSKE